MEISRSYRDLSDISDNIETNLPHKIKLIKRDKNNFINSTIHCLTNIITFLKQVSGSQMKDDDYSYPIFYSFFLEMSQLIMNKEEKENKNKNKILDDLHSQFYNCIISDEELFKNKSMHDPRILIDYIYNLFLKIDKINYDKSISHILNVQKAVKNEKIPFFLFNSLSELNDYDKNYKNYKIILKKTINCPDNKCQKKSDLYKYFSILDFILEYNEDKVYTLDYCFENFIKKENKEDDYKCPICDKKIKVKSDSLFYSLPNSLIISLYYNGGKSYQNYYFKFDEIIDFSKYNFINIEYKNKKYFLSSLIAVKFPKDENELFYTFCRKDMKSPFFIYNSVDVGRTVKNVNNKLIKMKNEEINKKKSFPVVLIYTSLEN